MENIIAEECEEISDALGALEQQVERLSVTSEDYSRLLRPVADAISLANRLVFWAATNFEERGVECADD